MQQHRSRSATSSRALRWVIDIIWILVWTMLFFMCIKVFGDTVGLVGMVLLILAMALIWYATERRQDPLQEKTE